MSFRHIHSNPALWFYTLLWQLWSSPVFDRALAVRLEAVRKEYPGLISLPEFSLADLEMWHGATRTVGSSTAKIAAFRVRERIAKHCFRDLAGQMRTSRARITFSSWSNNDRDEYIHVRRRTLLGDGMAVVTMVVSDVRWLKDQSSLPSNIFPEPCEEVHISVEPLK